MLRGGGWLVNSKSAFLHGFRHRTSYKLQSEFDLTSYGLHVVPRGLKPGSDTHGASRSTSANAPAGVLTNQAIGSYHDSLYGVFKGLCTSRKRLDDVVCRSEPIHACNGRYHRFLQAWLEACFGRYVMLLDFARLQFLTITSNSHLCTASSDERTRIL